jgi:hypothetical protein
MKNRILVFLVFITTILKGQSVDPETFPTLNSGIGLKYLYTNTGGEGKILVDSIATRVRAYWTNGVNGQDSLGLGGDLVQNTNVALNGYSMTFLNSPLSGFGSYPVGARKQYVMIEELNNNLGVLSISNDTTLGNEQITSGVSVKGLVSNSEAGFYNSYNLASNEQATYWRKYTTIDGNIVASLTKDNGLAIQPFSQVGVDTYLGDNIFTIVNTSNADIFKVKINGIINEQVPSYADDADAGANGLIQGDVYQTSGAGSAPLNIAGIRMIKQ